MKSLIISAVLIFGVSFLFTGCYTIVWDPTQEFPDEQNLSENTDFYDTEYYGSYGSFYETPWWITAPVYVVPVNNSLDKNQTKYRTNTGSSNDGRSADTQNIRNSGGERGNTDRNSENNVQPTTPTSSGSTGSTVIKTPPPTRDSNAGSSSSSNNTSTTSSSSSSDNGRSSSGSETRNNTGSRNSGSGRK